MINQLTGHADGISADSRSGVGHRIRLEAALLNARTDGVVPATNGVVLNEMSLKNESSETVSDGAQTSTISSARKEFLPIVLLHYGIIVTPFRNSQ